MHPSRGVCILHEEYASFTKSLISNGTSRCRSTPLDCTPWTSDCLHSISMYSSCLRPTTQKWRYATHWPTKPKYNNPISTPGLTQFPESSPDVHSLGRLQATSTSEHLTSEPVNTHYWETWIQVSRNKGRLSPGRVILSVVESHRSATAETTLEPILACLTGRLLEEALPDMVTSNIHRDRLGIASR